MLIEIPDNLARKVRAELNCDVAYHRRWAERWERDGQHYNAVLSWVSAALLEADLPEPVQVGHLAHAPKDPATYLVLHLGRERAFLQAEEGWETSRPIADLTYAGPKPEGWGAQ